MKRGITGKYLILIFMAIFIVFVAYACESYNRFNKPKELVPYTGIITKYKTIVSGNISQKSVQEVFTILKNIKEIPDKDTKLRIDNIKLEGMRLTLVNNGTISVRMGEHQGSVTSLYGWFYVLNFDINQSGRWVITDIGLGIE
jgi:hypothetical protein